MDNPAAFRKKDSGKRRFWCWATSCPKLNKIPKSCGENHTLNLCHSASALLVSSSTRSKSLMTPRPLFLSPPEGFQWEGAVKPLSKPAQSLLLQHSHTSEFTFISHFCPRLRNTAHFDCLPGRKAPGQQLHVHIPMSSTHLGNYNPPASLPNPQLAGTASTMSKIKDKGPLPEQDFQTQQVIGAGNITLWSKIQIGGQTRCQSSYFPEIP